MKRRTFIKKNAIVTLTPFITTGLLARNKKIKSLSEKPFQLNYAPHFGMFESMAGKDLMDQIQFMHDQGFRSLEDNGMKNRSKKTQNDIHEAAKKPRGRFRSPKWSPGHEQLIYFGGQKGSSKQGSWGLKAILTFSSCVDKVEQSMHIFHCDHHKGPKIDRKRHSNTKVL